MTITYILDGHEPVPCKDPEVWAEWFETADRHVGFDRIGDITISTVFIGIDYGHVSGGPPPMFETLIFRRGEDDRYRGEGMWRSPTWAAAEKNHAEAVALIRKELQ